MGVDGADKEQDQADRGRRAGQGQAEKAEQQPGRAGRLEGADLDQLCASYTDEELDLVAGFLRRTTTAGQAATEALTSDRGPTGPRAGRRDRTGAAA